MHNTCSSIYIKLPDENLLYIYGIIYIYIIIYNGMTRIRNNMVRSLHVTNSLINIINITVPIH
jgi:hypothetical protein